MEATVMQQGLNEVVVNKVQQMIENRQPGVQATMERLVNEGKIAQDFIAPIGVNLRMNDHQPVITFGANGHVLMNMKDEQYSLHENAVYQLAEKWVSPHGTYGSLRQAKNGNGSLPQLY